MDWSEGSGSSGWTLTATRMIYRLCVWPFSAKKNKKEEGPAGASPVAAPMLKSVSF